MADPKQATADQRPARFVRIEKAVEIPDKNVRKINNSAFGPAGMGMREILAYAPIEPDGSVRFEVPANVPFTIDILDKNARRIGAQHDSWLQLVPGRDEDLHRLPHPGNTANPISAVARPVGPDHVGVSRGDRPAGAPFPNTVASLSGRQTRATPWPDPCVEHLPDRRGDACSQIPSIDVHYTDVWTDPVAAGRPADAAYLLSVFGSVDAQAEQRALRDVGSALPQHHSLSRRTPCRPLRHSVAVGLSAAGRGDRLLTDHTCVSCHTPVNAAAAAQSTRRASWTCGASLRMWTRRFITSYEQLLFPRNEQTLNMGVLIDVMVPVPGPPTGPPDPVTGQPPS